MSEEKNRLYRERFKVEPEGGFVDAQPIKRPEGLVVTEESFGLKKEFGDFTETPQKPMDAVDVIAHQESFTVADVEADKLDDALEAIKRQQLDQQIRELIHEAWQLIREKSYAPALNVLEAAYHIAPTSASVLHPMGLCLFALREFDRAAALLASARQHSTEQELLIKILALQAACMRAIIGELEARLDVLKKAGREQEALRLVEERLRQYPDSVTLLYHRCALLLSLGRAEPAMRAAQEAIERGGKENADFFQRMYERATLLEYRPLLEPARQALRVTDAAQAVKLLRVCQTALKGVLFYETLRTYAREKDQVPSSGLVSIFSRQSEQPSTLADEPRQKILRWLLSEELDAAQDAISAHDYAGAILHLKRAANIDSQCDQINYLHGLAIYRIFLDRLNNQQQEPLNLEQCAKDLKAAGEYARVSSADPALGQRAKDLSAAINYYYEQLTGILDEYALLKRYNELMDYIERAKFRTMKEWTVARDRFLNLKQEARALRQGCSREQGQQILDRLIDALNRHLRAMDEIRADVQKHTLVNECLIEYRELLDYYKKYPIYTATALSQARARVRDLLNKLALARSSLGYDASKDSASRQSLRDYVTNWRSGSSLNASQPRTKPPDVDEKAWDLLNHLEEALREIQSNLESPR